MITEDLQPWLLEINSSPSMCVNTRVMEKMVDMVMDDMVKGINKSRYICKLLLTIYVDHE